MEQIKNQDVPAEGENNEETPAAPQEGDMDNNDNEGGDDNMDGNDGDSSEDENADGGDQM